MKISIALLIILLFCGSAYGEELDWAFTPFDKILAEAEDLTNKQFTEWEEVKPIIHKNPQTLVEGTCPSCGGNLVYVMVSCPEGMMGCLVLHYGYVCVDCGKQWEKKASIKNEEDTRVTFINSVSQGVANISSSGLVIPLANAVISSEKDELGEEIANLLKERIRKIYQEYGNGLKQLFKPQASQFVYSDRVKWYHDNCKWNTPCGFASIPYTVYWTGQDWSGIKTERYKDGGYRTWSFPVTTPKELLK